MAERVLRVGFTGTRDGMTEGQKRGLRSLLKTIRASHLHHGDCVGADADAHAIAQELGIKVETHPPTDKKLRAFCEGADVEHDAAPYLHRNKNIVDSTKILIATPKTPVEEIKSGTWSTIRYARKQEQRSVVVIPPDGKW
jgi:hypothetical protein